MATAEERQAAALERIADALERLTPVDLTKVDEIDHAENMLGCIEQIKQGALTLEQCPAEYRERIAAKLAQRRV